MSTIENFLALLQSGLRSQEVDDVAMVSSAVWALLSGCRKVRKLTDNITARNFTLGKGIPQKITLARTPEAFVYNTTRLWSV